MEKIKELEAKRAKIVAGLSNSNISDSIKKTMQEALQKIDEEIGKLKGEKAVTGDTETFDKLKKVFSSLKQDEKGFYIPSSSNDDKYIINKAKEQGIIIKIVDRVNDLTDLYDVYIEYVKDVKLNAKKPTSSNGLNVDNVKKGDILIYSDQDSYTEWEVLDVDNNGFTAKDDYETKRYEFVSLQKGWSKKGSETTKKKYFLLQNQDGNFYSRSLKGNSLWLDNYELAYPYEKEEAEKMLTMAKKEFPKMEIKLITLEAPTKSSIAKKIKEGVYEIDGVTYDLTKEVFYDKHPIGIVDPKGSQFVNVVKDYFRQKENLEKLVSSVLNLFSAKEILAKIKSAFEENLPDNSFRDMLLDDLAPASFFFFIKLPKIKKIIIKEFDLDLDQLEIFMDLEYKDEKFEKLQNKLVETIIENFTSKSQYAAMKSKELDSVKKRVYKQIMETPMQGSDSQNFHLHYFNANSDFYVKEVDYGTNKQDYGFVVLNGDIQNAEYGYTSIAELLKNNFELDLYFSKVDAKTFVEELKEKEIEVEDEEIDDMVRFYFKDSDGRKQTEAGEKLLKALKEKGATFTEIGFNYLNGEFTLKNKNKVKFSVLDNYGEFKNDFEIKPGEMMLNASLVYFLDDNGVKRTAEDIINETINDFSGLIEKYYGTVPSNDPTFTKYNGQEIMFVPVENKYYVNDVEFDTLDKAKKGIDELNKSKQDVKKEVKLKQAPSEDLIAELVRKATAQILFNYGTCTEILDIDEEIEENTNQLEVEFNLRKKDVTAKRKVIISLTSKEILNKNFAFILPKNMNVNQFLKQQIGDLDKRSQNQVYSFGSFLKEHSEEIVGKKLASKTISKATPEEKEKLKAAYTKKVKEKTSSQPKQVAGKVKLTKELIRHGVTQEMVDKVNKTGEGIVLKAVNRPSRGTSADKARPALKPGKRLSADGNIYYEYRRNMSDSGNKGL